MTPPSASSPGAGKGERGQILVVFAGAVIALLLLLGLVIDLGWYWSSQVRVQRAADAAALAAVVKLDPDSISAAVTAARSAAAQNGYVNGVGGVSLDVTRSPLADHRLRVTLSAPIGTFFMRMIGISQLPTTKVAEADYTTPVPMGSPDNAYGIFGTIRTTSGGTTVTTPGNTDFRSASSVGTDQWTSTPTASWTRVADLAASDNQWALASSNSKVLILGGFGQSIPAGATVSGIIISLEGYRSGSNCSVKIDLSWNSGTSWTSGSSGAKNRSLTATEATYTLGGSSDLWGRSGGWSAAEIGAPLRVRITSVFGSGCTWIRLDALSVRIDYTQETTVVDEVITGPDGQPLSIRGFWATMLTQGAENINGDPFLPQYNTRTSQPNTRYDPAGYYVYDVLVPAGRSGRLYIFDPGFCAGTLQTGVGDYWFSGTSAVSAFYELYAEIKHTPYKPSDDVLLWSSDTAGLFQNSNGSDPDLGASGGSGIGGCDAYHLGWYEIPVTLSANTRDAIYRLHTFSTDPSDATVQRNANAINGFALFTDVPGGRVYGEGAMEMLTPLPGGQNSTFYLAQIGDAYAGRTMEIKLFDPGDTNQNANISILAPTGSGWAATQFTWTATRGSTNSGTSSCTSTTPTTATNLVTYSAGHGLYNGCWLNIIVPIPPEYDAPQSGWWKIQYSMTGAAGSVSTDVTTWQVDILGNPVHLVIP
jgi:Flp pilus assembly protein TadG